MEDVIAEAKLPYDYEELSDMIETQAITGTAAFNVTVRSESPIEAELIANTIAKILPDRIAEIVDGSSVRIVDYAIVPAHRASPSFYREHHCRRSSWRLYKCRCRCGEIHGR